MNQARYTTRLTHTVVTSPEKARTPQRTYGVFSQLGGFQRAYGVISDGYGVFLMVTGFLAIYGVFMGHTG
jgi:hypothetical protein